MFIFSDFVPDETTRYLMGQYLIALSILQILVNNFAFVKVTVRQILLRLKRSCLIAKSKVTRKKKSAEKKD